MQNRLILGPSLAVAASEMTKRLVVYCAGWGTDAAAIEHMSLPPGVDVLVCWDYRDLTWDFASQDYQECHLVAWSMGVWAAEQTLSHWPWQSACAINGTPYPKHAQWGIDPQVFMATLAGLDEVGRHKFERRMCKSAIQLAHYQALVARPLEEIRQELIQINQSIETTTQNVETEAYSIDAAAYGKPKIAWTRVIIGAQDRIIPSAHQLAYWQLQETQIELIPEAHYIWDSFYAWEQLCPL